MGLRGVLTVKQCVLEVQSRNSSFQKKLFSYVKNSVILSCIILVTLVK